MFLKFTNSPAFQACAQQIFKKIDSNNNGCIDKNELTVAMCHLHYKLAKKIPGVTEPPTSEAITKAMIEFDLDQSGSLSYDEFLAFAKKWFSQRGFVFLRKLVISAVMTMVALPESANLIHREVPAARIVPKRIFNVVFGIIFKLVSRNIPAGN